MFSKQLGWLLLVIAGCGGKASANTTDIPGAGGAPASETLTDVLREVPADCTEGLNADCATAGDYDSCTHNATALITNAGPECLDEARAAIVCFAKTRVDCVDGKAATPSSCADTVKRANDCIFARADWSKVGCSAFHEPSDSGGVDSCTVTCGSLSATCTSQGQELSCVCDAGLAKGRTFNSKDCPAASALARTCDYEDLLDQ